jgi:hypothetical protein
MICRYKAPEDFMGKPLETPCDNCGHPSVMHTGTDGCFQCITNQRLARLEAEMGWGRR